MSKVKMKTGFYQGHNKLKIAEGTVLAIDSASLYGKVIIVSTFFRGST